MPTDADVTLRPAQREDADRIAALYTAVRVAAVPAMPPAVHTAEEDRAFFARQLGDGEHDAWVAEAGEDLVGFALLSRTWLVGLYVDPRVQRSGVGSALLEVVKAQRPGGFGLWVFESNEPARSFYSRHGLVALERTDGAGNEERAPDLKMVWPGRAPLGYYRQLIDDVDVELGDLLARRVALTRAVQDHKRASVPEPGRDDAREDEIAARVAARVPELGADQVARIVHEIITESIEASRR